LKLITHKYWLNGTTIGAGMTLGDAARCSINKAGMGTSAITLETKNKTAKRQHVKCITTHFSHDLVFWKT
jgi:hypothetical protein